MLRVNDCSVMDMAISINTLTGTQLKRVNVVREWFNVTYVSEISTINGRSLIPGIDTGISIRSIRGTTLQREHLNNPGQGDGVLIYGRKYYRSLPETRA